MANISRVRAVWSGTAGLPGISTFFFSDVVPPLGPVKTFLNAFNNFCPGQISIRVDATGDILESTNGLIVGSWSAPYPGTVQMSNTGGFSAPAGLSVRWGTGTIVNGRRLRGRTYIVPCSNAAFDSDGTLTAAALDTATAAAAAFIAAAPGLVVFNRPRKATPAWTDFRGVLHPAKVYRPGSFGVVTTATVRDVAAVLTSRRD